MRRRGSYEYSRGRGNGLYRGNRGGFGNSSRGRGRAPQRAEDKPLNIQRIEEFLNPGPWVEDSLDDSTSDRGQTSTNDGGGGRFSQDSSRGRGRALLRAEETNSNLQDVGLMGPVPAPTPPRMENKPSRGGSINVHTPERAQPASWTKPGPNANSPRGPSGHRQAAFAHPRAGQLARRTRASSGWNATHAAGHRPMDKKPEQWQSWSELTVRLYDLPPTVTTWDLWHRFERQGTIVFIELFETRQGRRDGNARVRFSPPPARDFWSSGRTIMWRPGGRGEYSIRIDVEPQKRSFQLRSPIRDNVWYPETMTLFPTAITFGLMNEETVMMEMRQCLDGWKEIKFDVDLLRSRLVVNFRTLLKDPLFDPQAAAGTIIPAKKYMFSISFSQLQKIYRVELDETHWALLLSLDHPPQFFQKKGDMRASHTDEALSWTDFDSWYRLTDVLRDSRVLEGKPISLRKEPTFIDIGRWTTYFLTIDKSRGEDRVWEKMSMALADYNIEVIHMENFTMAPGRPAAVWSLIDPPLTDLHSQLSQLDAETQNGAAYALPFEVRYQLEVCISQGVLQEHSITQNFIKQLSMMAEAGPTSARSLLEYIANQETRVFDPMTIFRDPAARAHSSKSRIPEYCTYVRKLTVTPTMLYYASPAVETSNRVIRRYAEHYGDRFLRVQFTDEKSLGRINSCADNSRNDRLFARVWRTLLNGIRVGDRVYEFLAFGNSQFRENGAYFFCPTPKLTCVDIRRWMGDFTDIRVVAKYAARLGLCFSTTRAINKSTVKIIKIPDVERNYHCFTDGVGKISEFMASTIAEELKLPPSNPTPSAFQFRLGGAKGVLVAWPDVKGREVHIRPSQSKFPSSSDSLEIIRCSHYSPATLNRQTITILSALGVPDEIFNGMMSEQLKNYKAAMTDRAIAQSSLSRYVDENHMTVIIASMIENGFMDVKEPFLLSLLHLWRAWSIKLLKEKARIIIENGAFLLGVTDETHTLRGHKESTTIPGDPLNLEDLPEIFVQIPDKDKKGSYAVVQGLCLVGRNPSLFPGDIRVVKAVDKPALHHLRDVIVFSQQGVRDVPSMCSGGDLDGDDFFCIWEKSLTPTEWNAVPMSYEAPRPWELDRPVEIEDVMKFFVRYMKNDSLPTIAHAHLAQSDFLERGIKDPKCLELAQLHSKAVDYVKTGEPAEMPKRLRPRVWPQFMQKNHRPKEQTYSSRKILGQLYDKVDSVNFVPQFKSPFDDRILKASPLDDALLGTVKKLKGRYDTAMRQIMNQLDIKTEFEVWSTFVLSSRRVGTDYKLQEDMAVVTNALKDRFRKVCIEAAGADGANDAERLTPFVAAMYKITADEMRVALTECSGTKTVSGIQVPKRRMEPKYMPLISFPWLFDGILGKIAKKANTRIDPPARLASLPRPSGSTRPQLGDNQWARVDDDKAPRFAEPENVVPRDVSEFVNIQDVESFLEDTFPGDTFRSVKSSSLAHRTEDDTPDEPFGFTRPYSVEDCCDDVYLGETGSSAGPSSVMNRSGDDGLAQVFDLPGPDPPTGRMDDIHHRETSRFGKPETLMDQSEDVSLGESFKLPRPDTLEDRIEDIYHGETFGFARHGSPEDRSEDIGPREASEIQGYESLELCTEDVYHGETFGFARPDSPEDRSFDVGHRKVSRAPGLNPLQVHLEDIYSGEFFTFENPSSLVGRSEDVNSQETFGLPKPDPLRVPVEDVYSDENFGLPRPDSLGSEDEADEEFYGYDSASAQPIPHDESADRMMTNAQNQSVSDGFYGAAVTKAILDKINKVSTTPSFADVKNSLSATFTSFANAGSSTMEDLADLYMDPPVIASAIPEASKINDMRIELGDVVSLGGLGEMVVAPQVTKETDEEEIIGIEEESPLDRLNKLVAS